MKKIILILLALFLTFTLLAKNETNSVGIGKYVVTFYTTYTEINPYFQTETDITIHLCTLCNAEKSE